MIVLPISPPPKSCARSPLTVSPLELKSPSQTPEVPSFRLPALPADEKYSAPAAVTVLTASATSSSWKTASAK